MRPRWRRTLVEQRQLSSVANQQGLPIELVARQRLAA